MTDPKLLDALTKAHPALAPLVMRYKASGTTASIETWIQTLITEEEPMVATAFQAFIASIIGQLVPQVAKPAAKS